MPLRSSYILPPNISGFCDPAKVPLPLLPVNDLQNYCEVACEGLGYHFERFIDFSTQKNRSYHLCCIEKEGQAYLIFLNKYHKVITFAALVEEMPNVYEAAAEMPRNQYVDLLDLAQAFTPYYLVLPVEVLMLPLDSDIPESAEVVQQLENVEFAEFSYYVPQTIGQVVFNNWAK